MKLNLIKMEKFKVKFIDSDTSETIEKIDETSFVPVAGDIILLKSKEKFKIQSRAISYNLSCVVCYGYLM